MTRCFPPSADSSGPCRPGKPSGASTLGELVEEYRGGQKESGGKHETLRALLEHYKKGKSLKEVIENAAHARNSKGKRHGHQYRIRKASIQNAVQILHAGIKDWTSCDSFDSLHDWLAAKCPKGSGLGALYVYDTSLRLGAYLGLKPKQVYLQAGALDGARALLPDAKAGKLDVGAFPKVMRVLKPHEIEDFLCIYKDKLGQYGS